MKNDLAILSREEILLSENKTISIGIDSLTMMKRAGESVANLIAGRFNRSKVYVICGTGNNAGDAIIAAKCLSDIGWLVTVMIPKDLSSSFTSEVKLALTSYNGRLLPLEPTLIDSDEDIIIIDGIFGLGLSRDVDAPFHDVIDYVNKLTNATVISVDIPSGIESDTGKIKGIAIEADITVIINFYKIGNVLYPGRKYCGEHFLADIGLVCSQKNIKYFVNSRNLWNIPSLNFNSNKYNRGYVIVYGGEINYAGASVLSAHAAFRSGSGIVKILCNKEDTFLYRSISWLSVILGSNAESLDERCNAVVIGPGMEVSEHTKKLVIDVLKTNVPCVIDAGALTSFVEDRDVLINHLHTKAILTPHEGEFKRLFPDCENEESKIQRALAAAKISGAIITLKGADTVIAHPDGRIIVNPTFAYNLSFAGSGDVLSGMIASFLSQKVKPFYAAAIAVYIHSLCATKIDQNIVADDIINYISLILQDLQK
ncbi:NAD(P)H-hydrate dehydratase [Anaplasmataceae bacterium AB001_6]|nr:NAD(P)H-hydrate dehydratase [Anaplasmataceae bacterium AB001_6]